MRQRSFFDGASGCVFAKRLHQPNGRGARVVDQNGRLTLRQGRRSVDNKYKEVERYDELAVCTGIVIALFHCDYLYALRRRARFLPGRVPSLALFFGNGGHTQETVLHAVLAGAVVAHARTDGGDVFQV